jgi:hypothetical protein
MEIAIAADHNGISNQARGEPLQDRNGLAGDKIRGMSAAGSTSIPSCSFPAEK